MPIKSFFKTLSILHYALLIGASMFLLLVYTQDNSFTSDMTTSDVFIYLVPFFAATSYFASMFIFKKLITKIHETDILENKLKKYFSASIIKYALIESASMLATVAYLLTGNALHLTIAITLLVYLYTQRPKKDSIKQEVPMNLEERKQFDI